MTEFKSDLGGLADPSLHQEPIDVSGVDPAILRKFLADMLTIRLAEETIGALVEEGLAKTPCHLAIGQEAVAVGTAASLDRRRPGLRRPPLPFAPARAGRRPVRADRGDPGQG